MFKHYTSRTEKDMQYIEIYIKIIKFFLSSRNSLPTREQLKLKYKNVKFLILISRVLTFTSYLQFSSFLVLQLSSSLQFSSFLVLQFYSTLFPQLSSSPVSQFPSSLVLQFSSSLVIQFSSSLVLQFFNYKVLNCFSDSCNHNVRTC